MAQRFARIDFESRLQVANQVRVVMRGGRTHLRRPGDEPIAQRSFAVWQPIDQQLGNFVLDPLNDVAEVRFPEIGFGVSALRCHYVFSSSVFVHEICPKNALDIRVVKPNAATGLREAGEG